MLNIESINHLPNNLFDSPWYAIILLKAVRNTNNTITDFSWVWGNKKFEQLFPQLPLGEGKKISEVLPQIHLNGEGNQFNWYAQVTETGNATEKEYVYTTKATGVSHWYRERITKVDDGVLVMLEDITGQKNNELELQRKNTLLQGVLDSTWSGLGVFKAVRDENNQIKDFLFVMLNKSAREMYADYLGDFDPKKGKLFSDAFPGGLAPNSNVERYTKVVETGEPFQIEFFYGYDNLNAWIRESGIKYEDGLVVSTEIITEQKNKTEELRKSQELSQAVVDSSLSGICILEAIRNPENTIVDFVYRLTNNKIKTIFPDHPAQAGKKLSEINPDTTKTADFKRWVKATQSGEPYQAKYLYTYGAKNGWIRETGVKYGDGVILTIEDITRQEENKEKLKRSEALLLESQEIAGIGAFEWNEQMSEGYWTPQLYRIFGIELNSVKITPHLVSSLVHPEDKQQYHQALKSIKSTKAPYTIEYRIITAGDTIKHIWERGRYLNGKITGAAMDITERKEMEIRMKKLATRNSELDTFVYTASHDLRSPVNNMETLLTFLDTEISERKESIEMYIQLLGKCITDLKATLRDLTHVTEIHPEKKELINLSEIIDEVKSGLLDQIKEAQADVKITLSTPFLNIPKRHARSLVYNMLSNAIKFRSKDRPLVVHISCFLKDNKIHILFADNGIGIKEENLPKVFQIFKRFNPEVEGRGIGMYLVKRVIDLNNGDIHLQSEENAGTTFHIEFPVTYSLYNE